MICPLCQTCHVYFYETCHESTTVKCVMSALRNLSYVCIEKPVMCLHCEPVIHQHCEPVILLHCEPVMCLHCETCHVSFIIKLVISPPWPHPIMRRIVCPIWSVSPASAWWRGTVEQLSLSVLLTQLSIWLFKAITRFLFADLLLIVLCH